MCAEADQNIVILFDLISYFYNLHSIFSSKCCADILHTHLCTLYMLGSSQGLDDGINNNLQKFSIHMSSTFCSKKLFWSLYSYIIYSRREGVFSSTISFICYFNEELVIPKLLMENIREVE